MKNYKILIIEDNKELAECFRIIINNSNVYEVVGVYNSFDVEVDLRKLYPDVILMDIQLPGMSGIEATKIIKKSFPSIKVIIISVHADEEQIIKALKNGADGYLSKDASYTEILEGIKNTLEGGAAITSNIAKKVFSSFQLNPNSPLSDRETEVLQKFADGYNYIKIADQLFVSKETIKSHMRNIYVKLGVNSKNEAVEMARANKFIL